MVTVYFLKLKAERDKRIRISSAGKEACAASVTGARASTECLFELNSGKAILAGCARRC